MVELMTAREAAEHGIKSSSEHAGDSWNDDAFHYLRWYSALMFRKGQTFHIEKFRQWAYSKGLPKPPEERAFGALTQKAIRMGLITPTGMYARALSSHLSPKMIYAPNDEREWRHGAL